MYLFIILIFLTNNSCSTSEKILDVAKNTSNQIEKHIISSIPIVSSIYKKYSAHVVNNSLTFAELAKEYTRPAEEYDVTTEDGYILKMYHIPGNKSNTVLVCHGILSSSDDFLIRGNISLIYMLVEQGFDVWAINLRGNRYTRKHIRLNPDTDKSFWNYTLHELGIYDYKAAIDFTLNKTREKQLSVVAHSAGNAAFFILMAERPEYNLKIKVFTALAPACYVRHIGDIANAVAKIGPIISPTLKILGFEEIAGYYSETRQVIKKICTEGKEGYELCSEVLSLVAGFSRENVEQEFVPVIFGHAPSGTNRKILAQYSDINRLNKFCKYDYGLKNIVEYGSFSPPVYDLKRTTASVALFAGKGDLFVGIDDILKLKNDLPNVVHYQVISDESFSHFDYVWSNNAHKVLYPYVRDILMKYNTYQEHKT